MNCVDGIKVKYTQQLCSLKVCQDVVPSLEIGTCAYYKNRHDNFLERHSSSKSSYPNCTPPKYYMNYGFKYCSKFKKETMSKLSPQGQIWLNETLVLLQKYMHEGLVNRYYISELNTSYNENYKLCEGDIEGHRNFYTSIECRDSHFQDFAFATHPDAYRPEEMSKLPTYDLMDVAGTPEWKEWLDGGTWEQALIVAKNMDKGEVLKNVMRQAHENDMIQQRIQIDMINNVVDKIKSLFQ